MAQASRELTAIFVASQAPCRPVLRQGCSLFATTVSPQWPAEVGNCACCVRAARPNSIVAGENAALRGGGRYTSRPHARRTGRGRNAETMHLREVWNMPGTGIFIMNTHTRVFTAPADARRGGFWDFISESCIVLT